MLKAGCGGVQVGVGIGGSGTAATTTGKHKQREKVELSPKTLLPGTRRSCDNQAVYPNAAEVETRPDRCLELKIGLSGGGGGRTLGRLVTGASGKERPRTNEPRSDDDNDEGSTEGMIVKIEKGRTDGAGRGEQGMKHTSLQGWQITVRKQDGYWM